MSELHPDSALIKAAGGPAIVARALGFDTTAGGTQRIQNWMYRGIPEIWRYKRPDIFGPAPVEPAGKAAA